MTGRRDKPDVDERPRKPAVLRRYPQRRWRRGSISWPRRSARRADITLRALDTLRAADAIAAEDTRNTRRLMELHGIPVAGRPILPYHDHNGAKMRPRLLKMLQDGGRVAYVSDAGTPLVADPGYQLARSAIDAGIPVTAAPGPSAVLVALTVSGLPTDRFLFRRLPAAAGRCAAQLDRGTRQRAGDRHPLRKPPARSSTVR